MKDNYLQLKGKNNNEELNEKYYMKIKEFLKNDYFKVKVNHKNLSFAFGVPLGLLQCFPSKPVYSIIDAYKNKTNLCPNRIYLIVNKLLQVLSL